MINEELRKEIEKEAKRRTQGFRNQENCIQSYIMGASDFVKREMEKHNLMSTWDMTLYAVKHKDWDGKIEYWNFFADCWVTPGEFNADCMTSAWAAEDFAKGNGGEIVKLKVDVTEID